MNGPCPRPRSATLTLIAALALAASSSPASGDVILQTGSSVTTTYMGSGLNRTDTSRSPRFVDNVLVYPGNPTGTPIYATLAAPIASQPSIVTTATRPGNNFTQTAATNSAFISPTRFGTGSNSTTLSSALPNGGAQANNAGVSFNPGSFVRSAATSSSNEAIVSVSRAVAIFTTDEESFRFTAPGVFVDVRGFVGATPGSYVALGLSGSFEVSSGATATLVRNFDIVIAYAGSSATQVAPPGSLFNTTSPPAGFQFEAIVSQVFSDLPPIAFGTTFTVRSTLTLIADPDSLIQLNSGPAPAGFIVPDFGAFAGGPVGVPVPEPSALAALSVGLTVVGLGRAWRARSARLG